MENAAADLSDPAVEDEVVHQVSGSVEGLSPDPRRTPAEETRAEGLTSEILSSQIKKIPETWR